MLSITLIRHAESEANAGLPTVSPSCIRITELGQQQAAALASTLVDPPCLLVVSPYIRTHQTAAPVIARHAAVPVEEWPVHEFTYLDPIHYSGTTETQRGEFAQHYWNRCDPHWNDGGGAESFAELITRIDQLEERFRQRQEKHIIVFTHGFFIKALLHRRDHPRAPVDATFMALFRDGKKNEHLANTALVQLSPLPSK